MGILFQTYAPGNKMDVVFFFQKCEIIIGMFSREWPMGELVTYGSRRFEIIFNADHLVLIVYGNIPSDDTEVWHLKGAGSNALNHFIPAGYFFGGQML